MTLQQLKYAVTVAECGTISAAAEKLFISQPSLTTAIRELESEMGVTIFSRTNRGVIVSREGEEFLGYARQILSQAQLLQELDAPAGRLFGLYAGETLCGAAVFQLAADEASLESVTIAPEHRGKGAGRALLTHALAALKAEGAALCFLEVRAHNAPALALYAALGFESVGRRKNFYKNPPEDALVMRAEL